MRTQLKPIRPVLAYLVFTVIYVVFFLDWPTWVFGTDSGETSEPLLPTSLNPAEFWPTTLVQWTFHLVASLLTLAVVALVVWRRRMRLSDIGIRPRWTRTSNPTKRRHWRRQARHVFWLVFVSYLVASVLRAVILFLAPDSLGASPVLEAGGVEGQVARAVMTLPISLTTSWLEEALNVAVLVILFAAAGRVPAEVYTVAVAAKIGYHLYFGLGGLAVALPALVCVWAYRRTGRLTPIILAHTAHNLLGSSLMLLAAAAI
ncbi:hypothetical protein BJF83_19935 [Nocardiopsis sp. CNR-923]|nr:hypothetical protein BJF83_19935 [Nocardiopsis sp. CNR-923]